MGPVVKSMPTRLAMLVELRIDATLQEALQRGGDCTHVSLRAGPAAHPLSMEFLIHRMQSRTDVAHPCPAHAGA